MPQVVLILAAHRETSCVPLSESSWSHRRGSITKAPVCEDRVLVGPASEEKGSKGRNELDCIRGKRRKGRTLIRSRSGPGPQTRIRCGFVVLLMRVCGP